MEDKQKESKNPKLNFIITIAILEKPNGSGTYLVSLEQTTFLFNQKYRYSKIKPRLLHVLFGYVRTALDTKVP